MNYKLTHFAPAGFPIQTELKIIGWSLVASALYSLRFLVNFFQAREALFDYTLAGKKVLIEGARMPEMSILIHNAFIAFVLVGFLAIGTACFHYAFHSMGSKSIYLMKRLPNRFELHKRCLFLPLATILACILSVLFLYLLYYGIYLCFTPKACLPTASLTLLRSVLL